MNDKNNTQNKPDAVLIPKESVVEVAKRHSGKDIALWGVAVLCLIGATLVSELAAYWAPANSVWVRVGISVALIVTALACLAFTHQGGAFKTLIKDAGVELRRITWPSKEETATYTWQVIVVTVIAGILIWLLDNFFNAVVGFVLG